MLHYLNLTHQVFWVFSPSLSTFDENTSMTIHYSNALCKVSVATAPLSMFLTEVTDEWSRVGRPAAMICVQWSGTTNELHWTRLSTSRRRSIVDCCDGGGDGCKEGASNPTGDVCCAIDKEPCTQRSVIACRASHGWSGML